MNEMVDTKDFASTILLLTELGRTLANSERASFWYWDKAKKQYWTLVALDSPRIVVPEGSGIVGASISGNETILINNPTRIRDLTRRWTGRPDIRLDRSSVFR